MFSNVAPFFERLSEVSGPAPENLKKYSESSSFIFQKVSYEALRVTGSTFLKWFPELVLWNY